MFTLGPMSAIPRRSDDPTAPTTTSPTGLGRVTLEKPIFLSASSLSVPVASILAKAGDNCTVYLTHRTFNALVTGDKAFTAEPSATAAIAFTPISVTAPVLNLI